MSSIPDHWRWFPESRYTDYSSGSQAPKRDFIREYVDAFQAAGLRVGLYYSADIGRRDAQRAAARGPDDPIPRDPARMCGAATTQTLGSGATVAR